MYGLAWLTGVCNKNINVGLSNFFANKNPHNYEDDMSTVRVMAHEIGHLFGGIHSKECENNPNHGMLGTRMTWGNFSSCNLERMRNHLANIPNERRHECIRCYINDQILPNFVKMERKINKRTRIIEKTYLGSSACIK